MISNLSTDEFAKYFGTMIVISSKLEYHIMKMIEKKRPFIKKIFKIKT